MAYPNDDPVSEFEETLRKRATTQYAASDKRAKQHQLAAARWGVTHRGLTSTAAVASAIAGTTLLTSGTGGWRVVAGILALMAAAFSTLDVTLKAGQLEEDHKRGFDGFTRMRTKWMQFKYVTLELDNSRQELAAEFQQLITERDQLSERLPAPPRWAVKIVDAERAKKKASRKQSAGDSNS